MHLGNNLKVFFFCFLSFVIFLTGCSDIPISHDRPVSARRQRNQDYGKLLGDSLDFGSKGSSAHTETGSIGVNSFLWHAVLDVFSYMPLKSVDPFGGVIITEWYVPVKDKKERFKVDIVILGRQLRSDGLRISIFKQIMNEDGKWVDDPIDSEMAKQLEDIVLVRARQLRIDS